LNRIGLVGAIYLGLLALVPTLLQGFLLSGTYYLSSFSGTSMLIMVGVALDTAAQVESYLIENRYEGFLVSGRLRGRR
jgi:preprotein translocase subunit SecY